MEGIFFTSYNPVPEQTDSTPCIGANGTDLCYMADNTNIRTIALSQDLVGRLNTKMFHYGDKVRLDSDNPQCRGVFQIEDTMNKRFIRRGDLFFMERELNTSCTANIYLIE